MKPHYNLINANTILDMNTLEQMRHLRMLNQTNHFTHATHSLWYVLLRVRVLAYSLRHQRNWICIDLYLGTLAVRTRSTINTLQSSSTIFSSYLHCSRGRAFFCVAFAATHTRNGGPKREILVGLRAHKDLIVKQSLFSALMCWNIVSKVDRLPILLLTIMAVKWPKYNRFFVLKGASTPDKVNASQTLSESRIRKSRSFLTVCNVVPSVARHSTK